MSMLSRYHKAGGFLQLLQLIETCGKQKQDNFLSIIDNESKRWGEAVREKMLTIERIFGWPDEVVSEVAARLQQLTLATALHGLKEEDRERLLRTFSHSQRRTIDDLFKVKVPAAAEISSAYIKILQEVRSMLTNGYIRADKFAPEMVIPEEIETSLGKAMAAAPPLASPEPSHVRTGAKAASTAPIAAAPSGDSAAQAQEIQSLRARVQVLTNENAHLKSELQVFREKLAQIKKIA